MKKRMLSLLLCAVMTIGTLSGCGSKTEKEEKTTNEKEAQAD